MSQDVWMHMFQRTHGRRQMHCTARCRVNTNRSFKRITRPAAVAGCRRFAQRFYPPTRRRFCWNHLNPSRKMNGARADHHLTRLRRIRDGGHGRTDEQRVSLAPPVSLHRLLDSSVPSHHLCPCTAAASVSRSGVKISLQFDGPGGRTRRGMLLVWSLRRPHWVVRGIKGICLKGQTREEPRHSNCPDLQGVT